MKKTAITTTERTNEIATNTNKKGPRSHPLRSRHLLGIRYDSYHSNGIRKRRQHRRNR